MFDFEECANPLSSHSILFCLVCGIEWVDASSPHSSQVNNYLISTSLRNKIIQLNLKNRHELIIKL